MKEIRRGCAINPFAIYYNHYFLCVLPVSMLSFNFSFAFFVYLSPPQCLLQFSHQMAFNNNAATIEYWPLLLAAINFSLLLRNPYHRTYVQVTLRPEPHRYNPKGGRFSRHLEHKSPMPSQVYEMTSQRHVIISFRGTSSST